MTITMDSLISLGIQKEASLWSNKNCGQADHVGIESFVDAVITFDLCLFPFLLATVHATFVIVLFAQFVRYKIRDPEKLSQSRGLGVMHRIAKWLCVALFFVSGLLAIRGGTAHSLYETVFYASQALAWLIIPIALHVEEAQSRALFSTILRAWWVACLVLCTLALATAVFTSSFLDVVLVFVPFVSSLFLVIICFAGYVYRHTIPAESDSAKAPLLENESLPESETLINSAFSRAGPLSVLTFSWLNQLLSTGYKTPLTIEDVPLLDPVDGANSNFEAFHEQWKRQILGSPSGAILPSLSWILLKTFWRPFMLSLALVQVWTISMFIGPVLQNLLITFMEGEHRKFTTGLSLVMILFTGKLVEGFSSHHLYFRSRKLGLRMWAGVGSAVYNKSLRLSLKARQDRSVGEITNLLSTDVQRLLELMYYVQQGLALPLQILIAVIILFQVVGVAMVAGLSTLAVVLVMNVFLIRRMRGYRREVVVAKDQRMRATTECLGNMKVIKLQAWDEMFKERIELLRENERGWVQKFMYAWATVIFMVWVGPLAVSAVTFLTMVLIGQPLTTASVFTALTTFRIIQSPIRFVPDIISNVIQATVSLQRVRSFLLEDEVDENAVERISYDSPYAVEIEGATFSWDKSEAIPAVKDLNLKINKGSCIAICGGVGSGKSSLLYCIMGELPKLCGTAKLSGRLAYVGQTAWIQNNSIRENILFGRAMDSKRYNEAVRVSGLEADLAQFPDGDETEIGERGTNLSGGQKQRIQLARAVYQDADVYLLDDPFSAVDAHTGTFLFEECVKGALVDKTVILVTHQVEFLSATDLIIVMRAPGEIVQKGTYDELVQEGKEFGSFVEALQESLESVTRASHTKQDVLMDSQSGTLLLRATSSGNKEELIAPLPGVRGSTELGSDRSSSEIADLDTSKKVNKFIDEEVREKGRVDAKVIWRYLTKVHNGVLCFVIVVPQISAIGLQAGSDVWLAWGTSRGKTPSLPFIEIYILFLVGCALSVLFRAMLVAYAGVATAQAFFEGMLNSIIRAPMSFMDSTPLGRILSRSSTDQTALDLELPNAISGTATNFFNLLNSVFITTYVTPEILFLVIPLAWMYIRLQIYYITSGRELSRLTSLTEAPVFLHVSESIAGATTIRAFEEQSRFRTTNSKRFEAYQRAYFHSLGATEWLGLRLDCLGATMLSSAALLLITLPENSIAPGLAGMSLSYGLALSGVLRKLVTSASSVENKLVSVERIIQYSDVPGEAPAVLEDRRPATDWPNAGRVELQKLQVRYRPGAPMVLKNVSCVIHPGEKVGVVGRTGSGKSTLIQALFRLIEPAGGRILVDDVDITTIGLRDLRSALGVIPQEPTLFAGTVRSNLDPFSLCADAQVWEALDKCQLGQVVRDKSQKLDASVSEQGDNWSVGERQLLCLARALLKRARILVLDEATASVDITTDAVIQSTIKQFFAGSTVISVAHRIPTVIDSDRVLVFDAGFLMENHSPEHLMANENSMFFKLVQEYTQRTGSHSSLESLDVTARPPLTLPS